MSHVLILEELPPVFFVTSATILAATASISDRQRLRAGWIVTAIAIDFCRPRCPCLRRRRTR